MLPSASDGCLYRDHAVIVGYGRVGRMIGAALKAQNLPYAVVEQNRQRVEDLRKEGLPVVYGDAAAPGVLGAANIECARLLIIAIPDGFQVRRVLELAREANPRIDTVARTHSESELAHLERQGVGMALMGERELALGMIGYALKGFGFSDDKIRLVLQSLRIVGAATAAPEERPAESPPLELPEPPRRAERKADAPESLG